MVDAETRRLVRQRAENRCEYCRLPEELGEVAFHVEHIIARQHQGDDGLSNLALACDRCNLTKGPNLSTKVEGETVELFHPRRHEWNDRFAFSGPEIVGVTPTGQATVQLLKNERSAPCCHPSSDVGTRRYALNFSPTSIFERRLLAAGLLRFVPFATREISENIFQQR